MSVCEEKVALVIPEDDIPLVLDFIAEATEHMENAEAGLLDLEKQPTDKDVINKIFRSFHTIKGMAGFLNLQEIGSLAHAAENLLDTARKGELALQGSPMDIIFESMDMMKKMVSFLKQSAESSQPISSQEGHADLIERLHQTLEGNTEAVPASQEKSDRSVTPSEPDPDSAPAPIEPPPEMDANLDKALDQVLEPVPQEPAVKMNVSKSKTHAADEKIKVSTTRLDSLIDMVGELVIANLMVAEEVKERLSAEHELGTKVSHLSKIVRELQELSMSMRMVPIQGVFQRMARLVRDLARKSNKEIRFETQGEETELDRTVVDKIADPLVHMIRNSVDHGIESGDIRTEAGKASMGTVQLRAFHKAGNVIIEIEDDGKGLDRDRIVQKAIDNGVIDPSQEISDEDVYRLIFHAGLSTAKEITDISGRGVGMDVVKKNIEELQGRVDITSTPGQGTRFTICLPLTLAVIDGQIVKVGDERYILPINSIINSFRPTQDQISSVQGQGEVVSIRGELLPLVRLYNLFEVIPQNESPDQGLLVIVEADGKRCCLFVDELLGQQQVVIKSLGDGLGMISGVSGGAIMGDGCVSLILDIPGLIELSRT